MTTINEVSYYLEKKHYDLIEYFHAMDSFYGIHGKRYNVLSCEILTESFGKKLLIDFLEYVKYDDIKYLMEYELKDVYEIFEYFRMDEAKILKILSDDNFKTLIEDKNNIKDYNQIF